MASATTSSGLLSGTELVTVPLSEPFVELASPKHRDTRNDDFAGCLLSEETLKTLSEEFQELYDDDILSFCSMDDVSQPNISSNEDLKYQSPLPLKSSVTLLRKGQQDCYPKNSFGFEQRMQHVPNSEAAQRVRHARLLRSSRWTTKSKMKHPFRRTDIIQDIRGDGSCASTSLWQKPKSKVRLLHQTASYNSRLDDMGKLPCDSAGQCDSADIVLDATSLVIRNGHHDGTPVCRTPHVSYRGFITTKGEAHDFIAHHCNEHGEIPLDLANQLPRPPGKEVPLLSYFSQYD